MIDVTYYKQFMGIDSFPNFDVQYFTPDVSRDYFYGAQAEYDINTKVHTLKLPKDYSVSRFLLFHELTHILDMEIYSTGERNHDYCLTGYMEYHASQIELMQMMGAAKISDTISFSMEKMVDNSEWTVRKYVDNKLETAMALIADRSQQTREQMDA